MPGSAPATAAQSSTPSEAATPGPGLSNPLSSAKHGCLATGDGYLRARIRGSMQLDVDLHNSELECDGGARPDGSGIRVSFAGPRRSDGRRLRMVFGVGSAAEGRAGHALPTNLTVIFEGEHQLFATRGDDKCTVDEMRQERLGTPGGSTRSYRVIARGFCIAPVSALQASGAILVTSFDFAGSVTFGDADKSMSAPTYRESACGQDERESDGQILHQTLGTDRCG
jgi:hypothetical protein